MRDVRSEEVVRSVLVMIDRAAKEGIVTSISCIRAIQRIIGYAPGTRYREYLLEAGYLESIEVKGRTARYRISGKGRALMGGNVIMDDSFGTIRFFSSQLSAALREFLSSDRRQGFASIFQMTPSERLALVRMVQDAADVSKQFASGLMSVHEQADRFHQNQPQPRS